MRAAESSGLDESTVRVVCSACIVTYHSEASTVVRLIGELIQQLQAVAEARGGRAELYLVANDGDLSFLETAHWQFTRAGGQASWRVRLYPTSSQGNVGYGAGHNLALLQTQSEFHLILNPDVELEPGSVECGIAFLAGHPSYVLAAPFATDAEGRYLFLAKRFPSVMVLALRALGMGAGDGFLGRRVRDYICGDRLPASTPQDIQLASGCCMLCRTSALQRVGGFDERFFLFFEDFDLSRRLADEGSLAEVPDFRIKHFGGGASRRGFRLVSHFIRSAFRFFRKYGWRFV